MAADRTGSQIGGIGTHDRCIKTANLDSGDSTYTQAGPFAGLAEPAAGNTGSLALDTSGDQVADSALNFQILQGGYPEPGIGAAGIWKRSADSATSYRGFEPPTIITDQLVLQYDSGSVEFANRGIATLPDGTVLALYEENVSGSTYRTTIQRRPAGSRVWDTATKYILSSASDGHRFPCLIVISNDLVLVAQWVDDTAGTKAQIEVYASTDQGLSWAPYAVAALADAVSTSTYTVGELAGAYNPTTGGIVLFGELTASTSTVIHNRIGQWASSRLGTRFDLIQISDGELSGQSFAGGVRPRVVSSGGAFIVIYIGYDQSLVQSSLITQRIPNARSPISFKFDTSGGSVAVAIRRISHVGDFNIATKLYQQSGGADASCALVVGGDNTLYLTARQDNITNEAASEGVWVLMATENHGVTWYMPGVSEKTVGGALSSVWWNAGREDLTPERVHMTWSEGQLLAVCNWATVAGTVDDTISILALGGHTTLCLPARVPFQGPGDRVSYEVTWLPIDQPATWADWTLTVGTGTAGLGEDTALNRMRLRVTTTAAGGQSHYWTHSGLLGTVDEGITVEIHVNYGAGDAAPNNQAGVRVQVADGTDDYAIRVDLGTDGYRIYDIHAGGYIGATVTANTDSGVALRVSLGRGKCAVYHRDLAASPAHDREWTLGDSSGSLTNDTASPAAANDLRFGHLNAASSTDKIVDWYAALNVDDKYNGAGLYDAPTNPDDLLPIAVSGAGARVYLADGLYLSGRGGFAHYGDTYDIATRYRYGIRELDPAISPSPARPWRSTADGVVADIAWDLSNTGELEQCENEYHFIAIVGCNIKNFSVATGNTSGTYTDVLANKSTARDLAGLDFIRVGGSVRPATTAAAGTRFIHRNELAGCTVVLDDGAGKIRYRTVIHNSAGVWTGNASSSLKPRISLDGVASDDPATGTLDIWLCNVLAIWTEDAVSSYRYLRLRIPSQSTADGYYQIGTVLVGCVQPFSFSPERAEVTHGYNISFRATQAGRRSHRKLGPVQRRYRLNWPSVDMSQLDGTGPDPDYIQATQVGTPPAAGVPSGTLYALQGLVEEMGGAPGVLIHRDDTDSTKRVHNEYGRHWIYGRVVSDELTRRVRLGRGELDAVEALSELVFEEEV